jgi:hypothetical protein
MSFRTLNKTEGTSNPSTKFLEWKSSEKCFSYWDKTTEKNVLVKLPVKFQFLEEFHTIKGFHEGSESGIYSNEIKFISTEKLTVKSFKSKEPLAEGLYNEIKDKVKSFGGKYGKSVYALLDGEIVNFQLYGASISPFMFFTNGDKKKGVKGYNHLLETNFIEVKDFTDEKKGANKYTAPVFSIGETYEPEEAELAAEKYKDIVNYFDKYTSKKEEAEKDATDKYEDMDIGDLSF